jgi:transposase-like protein
MSVSHTKPASTRDLRLMPGLGTVDFAAAGLPERLAERVEGELEIFAAHMRHGLLAAAVNVGLEVFAQMLETEVTEVAGPKGKHNPDRRAVRHGKDHASVPLGGRKVTVARPRVRAADGSGEIGLETWAALADRDLLDRHTLVSMLAGVSTRAYQTTLEPVGPTVEDSASSTSKSAVSRRFVEATRARLDAFRSRSLADRRWLIVYIDGFGLADEALIGALGVDATGNKVPLSVIHGTTENKTACKTLLDDLETRGFDPGAGVLFVLDGGKAAYHAVKDKWGDVALIQRCRAHKSRNVTDLLPTDRQGPVRAALHQAWALPDPAEADKALKTLASKIEKTHPDAAASLREGLADTITINYLGVTGALAKTLATTNPIESTIDIVKVHARNVKRWQPGDMRLRWAVAGMLCAEAQYRRVRGFAGLDRLAVAITAELARRNGRQPGAASAA